ncbi:MAG: hypothetical protein HIU88_10160 [Acidobacteria bacterium]|nr:hypothetical protein [Acidobacteriota bacterium]
MTDTTTPKPLSVRCPGCKTLIFNETLNIQTHKLVCPQDLKMRMQKLEERLDGIEGTVDELEQAPAAPEPTIDIGAIGEWPDDDDIPDITGLIIDEDDELAPVPATAHTNAASYYSTAADDPDDDL